MDGDTGSAAADTAAHRDPLTGLYQQDYLLYTLTDLLRRQPGTPAPASLALLQLENFYEIRQWVGRPEADLLLSDIARLAQRSLPESVLLCRCAHYEFAALFTGDTSAHAPLLIQRVKQALQSAVSDSIPPQLELKCGVGLARVEPSAVTADVVLARARHALGQTLVRQRHRLAPHTGHGAGVKPSPAQLRDMLQNRGLELNFQALANLQGEGPDHYEVRCQPRHAPVAPCVPALFEVAVRNALGEAMDRWVIGQCLDLLCTPGNARLYLTASLTQNTLVSTRFFDWLAERLQSRADLATRLVLQISELDLLITQHHMNHVSSRLARLQLRLCISDFGCMQDPFRYLTLLQAYAVKLDISLIEKIGFDQERCQHLDTTCSRLHALGLRVIAPLLEDMALLPLLKANGVHLAQGYCLHKPATTRHFQFPRKRVLDLAEIQPHTCRN